MTPPLDAAAAAETETATFTSLPKTAIFAIVMNLPNVDDVYSLCAALTYKNIDHDECRFLLKEWLIRHPTKERCANHTRLLTYLVAQGDMEMLRIMVARSDPYYTSYMHIESYSATCNSGASRWRSPCAGPTRRSPSSCSTAGHVASSGTRYPIASPHRCYACFSSATYRRMGCSHATVRIIGAGSTSSSTPCITRSTEVTSHTWTS